MWNFEENERVSVETERHSGGVRVKFMKFSKETRHTVNEFQS
jgi:hypothetical protein